MRRRGGCGGFTMVEMIGAMVVMGILGGTLALFAPRMISTAGLATSRADLADSIGLVLSRIQRDVRSALPNSVRTTTAACGAGTCSYLELVPLTGGGRYRQGIDPASALPACPRDDTTMSLASNGNDILSIGVPDTCVKTLGNADTADAAAGNWFVVYNLGQGVANADFYASGSATGGNKAKVTAIAQGTGETRLTFESNTFTYESADRRFSLAGSPISYVCDPVTGTVTMKTGYGISASQPTAFPSGASYVMATGVTSCQFVYTSGTVGSRLGTVSAAIGISNGGQSSLVQALTGVDNVP